MVYVIEEFAHGQVHFGASILYMASNLGFDEVTRSSELFLSKIEAIAKVTQSSLFLDSVIRAVLRTIAVVSTNLCG